MKILKSKLKNNQIQVITGDNCLQFPVIFNVYCCAFPSTFHKKTFKQYKASLVNENENQIVAFFIVI